MKRLSPRNKKLWFQEDAKTVIKKATLMSFPLVGNLSEKGRKDCGQAAMTEMTRMWS
jgi:hypothetical protein